jgi:hypothetical protein
MPVRTLARLAWALALLVPAIAAADTVIRSEILTLDNPSGEQVTTIADDGEIRVQYAFNDRGRGPEIQARYRTAPDGTLASAHVTGLAYMKTEVDERYTLADGKAQWTGSHESGSATPERPAHYLLLETTPEEIAILARALLQADGHTLALLPSGEARIEKLLEHELEGESLGLYAIHGLGLDPQLFWLDGERQLYASVSSWFNLIRAGKASQVQALLALQNEVEAGMTLRRAQRLARHIKRPLVIRNVRAFDPASGRFVGTTVVVEDGRIAAVGDDPDVPRNAETLDGEGRFLMPGLWDMHVHLGGAADGLMHIANGVTTVRDMANDNDALAQRSRDFDAGRDIGPRILKAGFIDGSGPFAGPTRALADDEETVREWIDRYAAEGYSQIKLYSSLRRDLVPGAIAYAHEKGLRVGGHVPVGLSARQFIEMGADELTHINFAILNFVAGEDADTRTPLRFSLVGDHGADLDLTGEPVRRFIELLKANDVVVDPTIATFEDLYASQPGVPPLTHAAVYPRLPASWQRRIAAGGGNLPANGGAATMRHGLAYERMIALIGDLHRSGVMIVAGTDQAAGVTMVRELELYVQAGIPPVEVLRIATHNAARAMKLDADRGSLAPGHVADLILVDGDPSRIVSDLRRVHTIIRGDRMFDADALNREVGIAPVARPAAAATKVASADVPAVAGAKQARVPASPGR